MPVYEIGSIDKDLKNLSLQPNLTKSTHSNDKITIPKAEFDSILEIMELLSTKMKNGTSNSTSLSAEKYDKYHLSFWCDMCPKDDDEICGVRYHCLECNNFDMCESCFVKFCENPDMNASFNYKDSQDQIPGTHYDYHDIKRIVPSRARPQHSVKNENIELADCKTKSESAVECNVLEFNVDHVDQELFDFYENLGTSTSVLRELKMRYEMHDVLQQKYDALLAEKRDLQKITNNEESDQKSVNSNATSDGIAVSFDLEDKNCIVFTILNDTKDYVIPKNSSLHFRFGKNKDDLTKCYLKLSDKESIQPGSLQILRFNHMFDDYNVLQGADYYEIKIMNNDKVLFERIIENPDATQSKFEDLKNDLRDDLKNDSKEEETLVLSELSIDEDYDILSEFDED